MMTTEEREAAENWLMETFVTDFDRMNYPEEVIRELPDAKIIRLMNLEYSGGYRQFLLDNQ